MKTVNPFSKALTSIFFTPMTTCTPRKLSTIEEQATGKYPTRANPGQRRRLGKLRKVNEL